jgi:hypothetical protein
MKRLRAWFIRPGGLINKELRDRDSRAVPGAGARAVVVGIAEEFHEAAASMAFQGG